MTAPDSQKIVINGFKLNCEECNCNKFFVYTPKKEAFSTYICAKCGNVIHQENLDFVKVKQE
jgi:hypothetical protein